MRVHDNPFAPPDEVEEGVESKPWLFDPKNQAHIVWHAPLQQRRWSRFVLHKLRAVGIIAVAVFLGFCSLMAFTAFIWSLAIAFEDSMLWGIPLGLLSFGGIVLGVVATFTTINWNQRYGMLWQLMPIRGMVDRKKQMGSDGESELHTATIQMIRRGFLKRRIKILDVAVVTRETEGLRIEGNRIDSFIPWGAIEFPLLQNPVVYSVIINLRKQCSPEYKQLILVPIPHDVHWRSRHWIRRLGEIQKRLVEFIPSGGG